MRKNQNTDKQKDILNRERERRVKYIAKYKHTKYPPEKKLKINTAVVNSASGECVSEGNETR